MKHGLLLLLVLGGAAGTARAQADLPDAGLPDMVVGGTGAERDSEEEDATLSSPCLSARDCDHGFACVNSKCTWQRYREATFDGCGAEATSGLWLSGALLLFLRRRVGWSRRSVRRRSRQSGFFFVKLTK